jgi:hypothetical protein
VDASVSAITGVTVTAVADDGATILRIVAFVMP